jgi:hypothetical protein
VSVLRGVARVVALIVVTAAGLGWLYLLFRARAATAGPPVPAALQLQRLAGGESQPLLRFVAAWLPTGLAAGAVLVALGCRGRITRALLAFGVVAVVLLGLGALADAVTASEAIRAHLSQQPQRLAPWLAAALVAGGAAVQRARA